MRTICLFLAAFLLSACGSSGTRADLSGTGKKSQVDGRVTGFGSIVVDGVRYPTPAVQIDFDGADGTLLGLQVGMVVSLQVNPEGEAVFIRYRDNVAGPVASLDLDSEEFVVLGQTVRVDELTTFDSVSLATLELGDQVEVSGVLDADGAILASYVEREDELRQESEVVGNVSALDTANQIFQINALVVNYSAAQIEISGGLREGSLVQVAGVLDPATNVLDAREIQIIDLVVRAPGDEPPGTGEQLISVSGVVRNVAQDGSRFLLNNFTVVVTADTQMSAGPSPVLSERMRVEVEGLLNTEQELVAQKIQQQPEVNFEIEGTVDSVDGAAGTLSLLGGVRVQITEDTSFKDDSELALREFGLADLRSGDRVEIAGVSSAGENVALRLERDDLDVDDDGDGEGDANKLRGAVTRADEDSGQFVVQGTTVQIDSDTEFEGYADAADFFSQVRPGDQVEIEGRYDAGAMILVARDIVAELPSRGRNGNGQGQSAQNPDPDDASEQDSDNARQRSAAGDERGGGTSASQGGSGEQGNGRDQGPAGGASSDQDAAGQSGDDHSDRSSSQSNASSAGPEESQRPAQPGSSQSEHAGAGPSGRADGQDGTQGRSAEQAGRPAEGEQPSNSNSDNNGNESGSSNADSGRRSQNHASGSSTDRAGEQRPTDGESGRSSSGGGPGRA